jgi:hypothetical protein
MLHSMKEEGVSMDANDALRFKAELLKERGLLDTPVEIGNVRRALERSEHQEPIGKKYFRTEEEAAAVDRLRTSTSSRVSARRLGISREQLRALEQGRG